MKKKLNEYFVYSSLVQSVVQGTIVIIVIASEIVCVAGSFVDAWKP